MKQTASFLEASKKRQTHKGKTDVILLNKKKTNVIQGMFKVFILFLTHSKAESVWGLPGPIYSY